MRWASTLFDPCYSLQVRYVLGDFLPFRVLFAGDCLFLGVSSNNGWPFHAFFLPVKGVNAAFFLSRNNSFSLCSFIRSLTNLSFRDAYKPQAMGISFLFIARETQVIKRVATLTVHLTKLHYSST